MKKFIIKFLTACGVVFLAACMLYLLVLSVIAPQELGSYNASILDKVERMKRIEEPKILLVGHSNLSFGMDSAQVEKEIGMPVVNLGLHGGLSNAFHEEIAKMDIDSGDIVIICHSYYGEENNKIGDCDLAWHTLENHFELWKLIPVESWWEMFGRLPVYLQKTGRAWLDKNGNQDSGQVYSRSAFNEYGDVAYDRRENMYDFGEGSVTPPQVGATAIRRINKLDEFCQKRGATLLIAGYPIGDGEHTKSREEFHAAWETLKEGVTCPVISEIEDYFFPYEML